MTIVGFTFTNISAEKSEGVKGKIKISNNVSITDVKETELILGSKDQKGLKFSFNFDSKYEPKAGSINLKGNVLFMQTTDKIKEIMNGWKKDKKIDKIIMKGILNTVLTKCNIEALVISREINLPSPIPLPKIDAKK